MAVAAGGDHSMILNQDGSVWDMGRNYQGQLGDGTTTRKDTFAFRASVTWCKDCGCRWWSQHAW